MMSPRTLTPPPLGSACAVGHSIHWMIGSGQSGSAMQMPRGSIGIVGMEYHPKIYTKGQFHICRGLIWRTRLFVCSCGLSAWLEFHIPLQAETVAETVHLVGGNRMNQAKFFTHKADPDSITPSWWVIWLNPCGAIKIPLLIPFHETWRL